MEWKLVLILVFVNIVYILLGGLFFHLLESSHEEDSKADLSEFKKKFLENHTCISEETFDNMIRVILAGYDEGLLPAVNATKSNWDYSGSTFFASTIITTIGYGHIAPVTTGGRVFCIFYALFGIPICLVMLAGLGFRLATVAKRLDKRLNMGYHEKAGRVVRGLLLFCLGFSLFVLVPAAMFYAVEGWGYDESVYYAMITLTTVGFGDYVAGQDPEKKYDWWYVLVLGAWIFLGLAWCATAISNAQELYEAFVHPEEGDGDDSLELSPEISSISVSREESADLTPAKGSMKHEHMVVSARVGPMEYNVETHAKSCAEEPAVPPPCLIHLPERMEESQTITRIIYQTAL